MAILRLIAAAISCGCLIALGTYIGLAYRGGNHTLHSTRIGRLLSWKQRVFLAMAALGLMICLVQGAEAMLFWLPTSWGTFDEDGEFLSLSLKLASGFAFVAGLPLISFIDDATHNLLALEIEQERAEFLERMVSAVHDGSLGSIRSDLEKKLATVSANIERVGTLRDLSLPNNRRVANYKALLERLESLEDFRGQAST